MTNKIKAEIISHSKRNNTGEEIITYKLTFPRIILSEVNTYKMLEKNTSSSRAIPFEKMVEVVEKEPFVPIAWSKPHKGMQGTEYLTDPKHIEDKNKNWLEARDKAVHCAKVLKQDIIKETNDGGLNYYHTPNTSLSKNYSNRLLEPFMWTTQLITGSRESFEHLFEQRCPIYNVDVHFTSPDGLIISSTITGKSKKEVIKFTKENSVLNDFSNKDDLWWLQHNKGQAEIHFMDLAEKMYDALNESEPDILKEDEWHIPFKKDILSKNDMISLENIIKMSVCLTAKVSYTKIGDENVITIEKAREMYDRLKNSGHWSCFGHIAKCMTNEEYNTCIKGRIYEDSSDYRTVIPEDTKGYNKNLRGFVSLRQYVENGVELKDA